MNTRDSALHDLKNLAGTLSLYLDTLVAEPDAPAREALAANARAASHLLANRLVLLLLDARSVQGVANRETDIRVDDFLDDLRCSVVLPPGVTYQVVNTTGVDAEAYLDAYLVSQLLESALHNAARHFKTTITLWVGHEGDELVLQVRNDIDPGKVGQQGTGFGLALAREIASRHIRQGKAGKATFAKDDTLATYTLRLPQ